VNVTPYILIGGRSSRFGSDKAAFEFQGETLAARAARICEEAFPDSKARFVSTVSGTFLDREMIADIYPDRGAAGAVHAALADARTPWIFVLACDLPLVTPEFISKLKEFTDDEHACVVPVQPDGKWQPLCAFYRTDVCLRILETAISGDHQPSLRAIAQTTEPRVVEIGEYSDLPDAPRLLTNVNTVADLDGI
jgi:molybdopterin-guanine dinucleotide biosynthesis protein A